MDLMDEVTLLSVTKIQLSSSCALQQVSRGSVFICTRPGENSQNDECRWHLAGQAPSGLIVDLVQLSQQKFQKPKSLKAHCIKTNDILSSLC